MAGIGFGRFPHGGPVKKMNPGKTEFNFLEKKDRKEKMKFNRKKKTLYFRKALLGV